jgi:hypothetical protein
MNRTTISTAQNRLGLAFGTPFLRADTALGELERVEHIPKPVLVRLVPFEQVDLRLLQATVELGAAVLHHEPKRRPILLGYLADQICPSVV